MNLLMVSPDGPPYHGGISRLVGLLKDELERSEFKVTLLHPNFRFREIKFPKIPFQQQDRNYDLIHVHGPTPFLSDLVLIKNRRVPIVYTHHAEICWISEKLSKVYRDFHRFLTSRAKVVVVHSYDYARLFKRNNVVVFPMPCVFKSPNNFNATKKASSFTVLYVGQFRPFKGIDILIEAAKTLRNVDFILVGDGYLKPKYMHIAKDLKNVRFCGAISDENLRKLYEYAHVICLPSVNTTEAYGLVLIEGALYGCIPLASNLVGVRENVSKLRGVSFEPRSRTSLVERIKMLLDDRDLWIDLAKRSQKAASEYVNMYTPEYYANRHKEVYRKCLS